MLLRHVIGHRDVIEALVAAHHRQTVHHAYLFAGPDGIGKRQVAVGFAAMMNCVGEPPRDEEGRAIDACGECRSCRRMLAEPAGGDARIHPDLLRLEPDGKQIKIDQVRDVIKVVPYPPIEAAYRVVLIDPADAMGEAAANALLKTLEEPSSRTRFVLVSSRPDALLITIRSRCQRMVFGRLPDESIEQGLVERFDVRPEDAAAVASMADGSLGAALALLHDPIMQRREELVRSLVSLRPGDARGAFRLAEELAESKENLPTVFELLKRVYRDLLLLRSGSRAKRLSLPHLADDLDTLARRYGASGLLLRLEVIGETERGIKERNLNARLGLERLLLTLTAPPGEEGVAGR